jgi:hypothetical protein
MKTSIHLSSGWRILGVLAVVLSGAVGCSVPGWEPSEEPPPEQPVVQPPEIVSTSVSREVPQGEFFRFHVEALDPQNSPLHFSWKASSGAFVAPRMDTSTASEIRWVAPPCTEKVDLPVITVTVTNALGLSGSTQFKITYAMYCNSWSEGGGMFLARRGHTLTRLNAGQVLVAGGLGAEGYIPGSELIDPETFATTPSGVLRTPRALHIAAVLGPGLVLITGGFNETGPLRSAELYDSATGQWIHTADMNTPRVLHTATVLSPFRVLVTGGVGPGGSVFSAETYDYDPDQQRGTWTLVPGMPGERQ